MRPVPAGAALLLFHCLLLLTAGTSAALELQVTVAGSPVWQEESQGVTVRWAGLPRLQDPQAPALPYQDITVLLGPGERLDTVELIPLDAAVRHLNGRVTAGRQPQTGEGDAGTPWSPRRSDATFPANWGEVLGTSTWHGYQLGHVRIYPVRLEAEGAGEGWERARSARRFTLRATTRPATRATVRRLRAVAGEEARIQQQLRVSVLNARALEAYPRLETTAAAKTLDGYRPTDAPSLEGSEVQFLIVTNEALRPAFEPLADYRSAQGVPTVVRTMEWILANTLPAADPQATLRSFLADAYSRWGVRWVLLGGDVEVVPTRTVFNTYYPFQKGSEIPVDLYYGGLDGDWNADRDENLGEPYLNGFDQGDDADLVPELHVGRAPVASLAQAQTFVTKILDYERDHTGPYQGRALFMSEVLFPSDYSPGETITDDGASYSEAIIASALAGRSYEYDRHYEASDLWPGSLPETRTGVLAAMNSGEYGIVNHIGHGFFYNMSVGTQTLNTKDAEALVNGNQLFLLNNLNCASAAFDYNSIMERFVTNVEGGAVAAVGSSRAAFPTVASGYQENFFTSLFVTGARTLGAVVTDSRTPYDSMTFQNTVQRWTHMTLTLIGDPTLHIYTAAPQPLSVTAPAALDIGEQAVTVTVTRDGQPAAGATICLWKEGDDYAVVTADASGEAVVPIHLRSPGVLRVTATAVDSPPLEVAVPVGGGQGAYLALAGMSIVDDGSLGSQGNADGAPDAGETIALSTSWTNTGTGDAGGPGTLAVTTTDSLVEVLSGPVTLPALASGASGTTAAPLLISLDAALTDREEISLVFQGQIDGTAVSQPYVLEVYAPVIEAGTLTFSDYPHGDGDGVMEDGELLRLQLSLLNTGWGRASGLVGWIDTGNPNITVVEGIGSWPDADRYAEVSQQQEFLLSMVAVNESLEAVLHLADDRGHQWEHRFSLTRPATPSISTVTSNSQGEVLLVWEPNEEADLLGYHVQRAAASGGPYTRLTMRPIEGAAFYRDTGLEPLTRYYYKVAAVDSSRFLSPYALPLSASTPPAEQDGFPIVMPVETSSHVAVGDVDGDGQPDLVTAADAIFVWKSDGDELRDGDGDPTTLGPFVDNGEIWTPAGVTLADVTADPGMEIVASCRSNNNIYVFQSDGSIAPGWPRPMNNWNWATPAAGDVDGDGLVEIVVTNIQGRTYAWNHDGSELLDGDADPATDGVFHERPSEWYSYATPALADLDGDGACEVIFGTRRSDAESDLLHALRANGTEPTGWPVDLTVYGGSLDSPAVGDLDQDGILEIVLVTENDLLHVLDQHGVAKPGFPLPFVANSSPLGQSCPSPALGDIDGDGVLDIVAVAVASATAAEIHVLGLDGQSRPGWPQAVAGSSECSPILGDVTGDGLPDIIFGIGGSSDSVPNLLYAFRNDGATIPGFPLGLDGPVRATPTLTDLNGDGDVDLIYAGWDLAMHVWDFPAPWDPQAAPWPTFHADAQRRGRLPGPALTGVAPESTALPTVLALEPNAPNPFNPVTSIRFALPAGTAGRVKLRVFDLKGRVVRNLVDGRLPAGRHEVQWRGRDEDGREMASGVYLYRLEAGGRSALGRMTLVR